MLTMKQIIFAGCVVFIVIGFGGPHSFAQTDGLLRPLAGNGDGLPAGAVYENGVVLHPITSSEENLHLLAGFYYRNPRDWKRIYHNNRQIIKNPNRLPVGQTLKIEVGKNWKPLFSYDEWFRLANRNGQWHPKRSRSNAGGSSKTSRSPSRKTPEVTTSPPLKPVSPATTAEQPQTPPGQQPSALIDEENAPEKPSAEEEDAPEKPSAEEEDVAPAF